MSTYKLLNIKDIKPIQKIIDLCIKFTGTVHIRLDPQSLLVLENTPILFHSFKIIL